MRSAKTKAALKIESRSNLNSTRCLHIDELVGQRQLRLSQFISAAAEIALRLHCQHHEIIFVEESHQERYFCESYDDFAQLAESQIVSRSRGTADERSEFGGRHIEIGRSAFIS